MQKFQLLNIGEKNMKAAKGKILKKIKSIGYLNQDRDLQTNGSNGFVDFYTNIKAQPLTCREGVRQNVKENNVFNVSSEVVRDLEGDEMEINGGDDIDDKENVRPGVKANKEEKSIKVETLNRKEVPLAEIDVTCFRRPDMNSCSLFDPGLLAAFELAVKEHMRMSEAERRIRLEEDNVEKEIEEISRIDEEQQQEENIEMRVLDRPWKACRVDENPLLGSEEDNVEKKEIEEISTIDEKQQKQDEKQEEEEEEEEEEDNIEMRVLDRPRKVCRIDENPSLGFKEDNVEKKETEETSRIDEEQKQDNIETRVIERPPLLGFEYKCPPGGDGSVIIYTTTISGIRKTFEDCNKIRFLLDSFRVLYFERDVSLHSEYKEELWRVLGDRPPVVVPPRLFIKGRYIGGAEEVLTLHEQEKLRVLFDAIPTDNSSGNCEGCARFRFVLCFNCHGSHRLVGDDGLSSKCGFCNESGLIKCPYCCC